MINTVVYFILAFLCIDLEPTEETHIEFLVKRAFMYVFIILACLNLMSFHRSVFEGLF